MTTLATEKEEDPPSEEDPHGDQAEATKSPNVEQNSLEAAGEEVKEAAGEEIKAADKETCSFETVNEGKKQVGKNVVARRLGLPLKSDVGDLKKLRTAAVQNQAVKTDAVAHSPGGEKEVIRQPSNRVLQFRGVAGRALAAVTGARNKDKMQWGGSKLRMDEDAVNVERRVKTMVTNPKPRKTDRSGGFGYGHGGETNESDDKKAKPDIEDNDDENERVGGKRFAKRASGIASAPARAPQDLRSRNILGKMLGHLKSAKSEFAKHDLVHASEGDRWAPRRSPSHDLSSDDSSDDSSQAKRRKTYHRKVAGTQEEEMINLQERLEIHYSTMKKFIRTRATPTIFFLPAKHNKKTLKELEDTRETIDQKISSLKAHLRGDSNEDDEDDRCVS